MPDKKKNESYAQSEHRQENEYRNDEERLNQSRDKKLNGPNRPST